MDEEAEGVANFILDQIRNRGRQPNDVLVLAQRRAIGNPIHEALLEREVPSKSYYQEREVENLSAQERLAFLKLFIDRNDRIALRWLLGVGHANFRREPYARIRQYAEDNGGTPWDIMVRLEGGIIRIPRTNSLRDRFTEIRAELDALQGNGSIEAFVGRWLRDDIEEIDELRGLVHDLIEEADEPNELLAALVEAISTPEIPPDVTDVRIMSLHKSKGLSSPIVVVAGCVEGLLPTAPDLDQTVAEQRASLEEQRRLLYVGLTRVKSMPAARRPGELLLTYSRSMSLADAKQSGIEPARVAYGTAYVNASRFIRELGPEAPRPRLG